MDTPPLVDLVTQLHELGIIRKDLAAADKELKQKEADLELLIEQAMPEDQVSIALQLADGRATISRKFKTVYTTAAGSADTFFEFVRSTGQIEFLTRAVKQEAVVTYVTEHGQPPPGIEAIVKGSLGLTFKRNTPQ